MRARLTLCLLLAAALPAAEPDLASVIEAPATVLRLHQPGLRLRELRASELWARVLASPAWEAWRSGPEGRKAEQLTRVVSSFTGLEPLDLIEQNLGDELVVGVTDDGLGPQRGIALMRFASAAELAARWARLRERIEGAIGLWPLGEARVRGDVEIYAVRELCIAMRGDVLAVADDEARVLAALDALAVAPPAPPAEDPAPLADVRIDGGVPGLAALPARLDQPLASLLGGHWRLVLAQARGVAVRLERTADGLRLRAAVAHARDGEALAAFVPAPAGDGLAEALALDGRLASGRLHRDWARWWADSPSLLDDRGLHELAKLEQGLDLVFAGHSVRDEVLPQLDPEVIVVLGRQAFADLPRTPTPALPGLAVVLKSRDATTLDRRLRGGLQALAGIATADQAQKGMDTILQVEVERIGEHRLSCLLRDGPPAAEPGIEDNFSACLATVGDRVLISSSRELGRELVEILAAHQAGARAATGPAAAERWTIHAGRLAEVAVDNRETIVADQILKEGRTRAEAETRYAALIEALALLEDVVLVGRPDGGTYRLDLDLRWAR